MDTDLKIESWVFSSGAFSACLVRQISPSSASILSQSSTRGQPRIDFNNENYRVYIKYYWCWLTGHDDCVRFFLILTKTSNTIERPVVIVNRIEQFRMFLMTELLHVQVQKGLPLHLWRLFLSWSYSEVEAIETGTVQLTGKRNRGFFFEENEGKSFF